MPNLTNAEKEEAMKPYLLVQEILGHYIVLVQNKDKIVCLSNSYKSNKIIN